jgi:hypothetical protein
MPATYEPIATTTLGSTAGIITFASIPQTYTDLILVQNARVSSAYDITAIRINSVTTNYSGTYLESNGAGSTTAGRGTAEIALRAGYVPGTSYTNEWSTEIYNFLNYTNSSQNKTVLSRTSFVNSAVGFNIQAKVSLVPTTAAITQITTQPVNGALWAIGSTFTLYGIKAA